MKSHEYFQSSPLAEQIRGWYLTRVTYPNLYVSKKLQESVLWASDKIMSTAMENTELRQKCPACLWPWNHIYISAYRRLWTPLYHL